jgi:TATA-box binding protein (TBP) (component of TFIID and TFIIIB)
MEINWDSYNFKDYLQVKNNEITDLSININISTMCASCKLNTKINLINIQNFMQLNSNDVLSIKKDDKNIRTLLNPVKKPVRNKKNTNNKNHFYNQITIIIRINHGNYSKINDEPKINLKLFSNGSVQMSGCKSLKDINIVLNKLVYKLKEIKAKKEDNGLIVEKPFIENINDLDIIDFKIDMINSNYQVAMQINRYKLINLLIKKKIKSSFQPNIRACVIIKYVPSEDNINDREVSIFIFEKGNIIITGAKTKKHIIMAYNFINDILLKHKDEIIKQDEEDLIMNLYDKYLQVNNHHN